MKNQERSRYDARIKEVQLRTESESWDTSKIEKARVDDIPIINLREYFETQSEEELEKLSAQLLSASVDIGFYYVQGHGISPNLIAETFSESKRFHDMPLKDKDAVRMDQKEWPVKGVGYLPFQNRKLPTRKKGNANEAFIIKRQLCETNVDLGDNLWPGEDKLPGFRQKITAYASAMERLALRLLPIYGRALGLPPHFFDEGFTSPMYRLRLTKYPSIKSYEVDEFGIAPHVDSTFITILSQDKEGLIIYNEKRKCWILAPVLKDSFIINTGELLRQWTNDRFISVKHFANNNYSDSPRYSIPFFFNATADYRMHCIPTCCSENNPPRYPPFSYLESQASTQGE